MQENDIVIIISSSISSISIIMLEPSNLIRERTAQTKESARTRALFLSLYVYMFQSLTPATPAVLVEGNRSGPT